MTEIFKKIKRRFTVITSINGKSIITGADEIEVLPATRKVVVKIEGEEPITVDQDNTFIYDEEEE